MASNTGKEAGSASAKAAKRSPLRHSAERRDAGLKKIWNLCLLAFCLSAVCLCLTGGAKTAVPPAEKPAEELVKKPEGMAWLEEKDQLTDGKFVPAQSAVLRTGKRRASVYSWSMSLLCDGAFFDLSRMLSELEIGRVYQEIPEVYLSRAETAVMVDNLAKMGIETVFLTGERKWGYEDLDEFYRQIDALREFDDEIGTSTPIKAVALDVESYTREEWKEAPEEYFAQYVENMADAYQYAHERGFNVIQVIPTHLDTIDRTLFEEFVRRCCDELSIMNYKKDQEFSSIWNEVLVCRELGKPVETIFETMPLNDKYSVTKEKTYFYDGMETLKKAEKALLDLYGDSLGISYHHYQTLYHVYTGAYIAEIYPYTTRDDSQRDKNGQPKVLESILLRGSDGSLQVAYPYNPNLLEDHSEACYLAVGVKPKVAYTVTMQSQTYGVKKGDDKLRFDFGDGNVVDVEALHVRRLR